jgi:electron transport complex protein RnfB
VLCIDACPFDTIAGAPKRMHTVLAALCTGCELCLAPCPVDCIAMVPAGRAWSAADAVEARRRYNARRDRAGTGAGTPAVPPLPAFGGEDAERDFRRQAAAAAIERVRARRASGPRKAGSGR